MADLDDNQLAYYKLDGNSDDEVASNDGSDTAITYSDANGKINNGAGFNGSTSTIQLSKIFDGLNPNMTIAFWIKTTQNDAYLISQWSGSSSSNYKWELTMELGKLIFSDRDTNWRFDETTANNTAINDGDWHHVAFVKSGGTLGTYYVDGVADGTKSGASVNYSTNYDVYISGEHFGTASDFFNGAIDEVGFWDRALSRDEIATIYNAGVGQQYPYSASELGDWANRKEITIPATNIDSNLTHFPVLLTLGTSVGTGGADVSDIFDELTSDANRKKIAITTSDGVSQLYAEIEEWDDANEKATIWVSRSDFVLSSSSTTTLYFYYDSSQDDNTTYIADTGSRTEVWSSATNVAFNLSNLKDGKGNVSDLTNGGADLTTGKIADCYDFDGSSEKLTIPQDSAMRPSAPFVVSAWIYTDNNANNNPVIFSNAYDSGDRYTGWWIFVSDKVTFNYGSNTSNSTSTEEDIL
jgi:hypothetical protein